MRRVSRIAVAAVVLLLEGRAVAHGLRTAYFEINESDDEQVLATIKTALPDLGLQPRFPEPCTTLAAPTPGSGRVRTFALRCPGGLAGKTIAIAGLGPVHTEAVLRVTRPGGEVGARVLTREHPAWTVPARDSWPRVGVQYVRLGIAHILSGFDHLLFLLALVLYVGRLRVLLLTETAFTLSHSVTFSLTALGLIHVSASAAEACIALSLTLVALDIGSGPPEARVKWQAPLIALVFGLVHGLGFAGGLSEIGLPDQAIASALIGFGVGVELGQIAFLAVAVLAIELARRASARAHNWIRTGATYAVGVTGCYWLSQRLWVCFASGLG